MGVIMGTAAYMSPEQARGKAVDKRADIWAFGAVLFEMLTGRKAFEGEDVSLTLSAVLQREPDWNALPNGVPLALKTYLRRCFEKDPRQRIRDIGDVRLALNGVFETTVITPDAAAPQPAGWRQALPLALGMSAVAVVLIGLAVWSLTRPAVPLPSRLAIMAPSGVQPSLPVRSPDGRTVAFQGVGEGRPQTYIRDLGQLEGVPLSDSEGTLPKSFSPDSQWLLIADLFSLPRELKRVPLEGGQPVLVAEWPTTFNRGAAWGPDDTIILGSNEGLWSMAVSGQGHAQLTTLAEGELGHFFPRFLPSGRAVLFHIGSDDNSQVAVYDFDTGERQTLLPGTSPQFATSGHLVFWRQGSLWAVPFDPDRLQVTGQPLPVVENVLANSVGFASYDATGTDGTLLYVSADAQAGARASLVWVDREGNEERVPVEPRNYREVRLSPRGRRIATNVSGNILIYDLDRRALTTSPSIPLAACGRCGRRMESKWCLGHSATAMCRTSTEEPQTARGRWSG